MAVVLILEPHHCRNQRPTALYRHEEQQIQQAHQSIREPTGKVGFHLQADQPAATPLKCLTAPTRPAPALHLIKNPLCSILETPQQGAPCCQTEASRAPG